MTIGDGIAAFGFALAFSVVIWSIIGMPYWVMKHRNDREADIIQTAMEKGIDSGKFEWSGRDTNEG